MEAMSSSPPLLTLMTPGETQKQLLRIIANTNMEHLTHRKGNSGQGQAQGQQNLRESRRNKENIIKCIKKKKEKKVPWWKKGIQCIVELFQCGSGSTVQSKIFVKKTEELFREVLSQIPASSIGHQSQNSCDRLRRQKLDDFDFKLAFWSENTELRMFSKIRPGTEQFLQQMSKIFELVLYTNCEKDHANAILENISKPGQFKHKLYRSKCLSLNQINYLKELRKLNRQPSRTIFLDCNVATGVLQPLNFHQIPRYKGNANDKELEKVGAFLKWLAEKEDVTPIFRNYQVFAEEKMGLGLVRLGLKREESGAQSSLKSSLKLKRQISFADRLIQPRLSRFRQPPISNQFYEDPIAQKCKNEQPINIQLEASQADLKCQNKLSQLKINEPNPSLDLTKKISFSSNCGLGDLRMSRKEPIIRRIRKVSQTELMSKQESSSSDVSVPTVVVRVE